MRKAIEWSRLAPRPKEEDKTGALYWHPVDLSEEEIGEMCFSERRLLKLIDNWRGFAQLRYDMHRFKKGKDLRNEILEHAIKPGRIEGYASHSLQQRFAPGAGLITLGALIKAVDDDSDEIMLSGGDKLFCARLVVAEVTTEAPTPQVITQAAAKADVAQVETVGTAVKARKARRECRPTATEEQVREAARAMYSAATTAGENPPDIIESTKRVRGRLKDQGLYAKWDDVMPILQEDEFAACRNKQGKHLRKP
jgi:hypothetical protein